VGIVGLLGIEPGVPNAYPSPAFMPGLLGAFGEAGEALPEDLSIGSRRSAAGK
jgi:hypothetical protein